MSAARRIRLASLARTSWRWLVLPAVVVGLLAACSRSEGEVLFQERCTTCHEKAEVVAVGRTREDWTRVIDRMAVFGAKLDEDERLTLIDYLTETYGP